MGELCPWTRVSLAEILVLAGGGILPAPAVPASTRIFARLKYVQEHSSAVSILAVAKKEAEALMNRIFKRMLHAAVSRAFTSWVSD